MWDYIIDFYNNIWHQYWTIFDLFITIYIFYMLAKLNKTLSNINKGKDK